MEGPLLATGSTCQLVLEQMWGALLVISGSWRHSLSLPVLSWVMLVCTVVLVFLVKRQLTLRRATVLSKRCSDHHEVCEGSSENIGSITQADDALRPPTMVTSPPTLQTLCLSAMNTNLSKLHWDIVNFLKKVQKSQPPKLPQVTGEKPTVRKSEKDGEQLARKKMNDLSENTYFPEQPELLNQDISRWRQKGQEKEGEVRLEQSKAPMEPVLKDQASASWSKAGPRLQAIPSPDLPVDLAGARTWGVQKKRRAENGDLSTHQAVLDLKGVADIADFSVSPPSPRGEHQDKVRQLWAEKGEIAGLTRQIHCLQTQEASLQQENSWLDSEIQQLKLKLQNTQDEPDQHILQLHRKEFQGQAQHVEMKKKLATVYRDMNFTCQFRNLYKKRAQDLGKELERNSSHQRKAVLFHHDRATKSWVAAVSSERKFQELKKENDHMRPTEENVVLKTEKKNLK